MKSSDAQKNMNFLHEAEKLKTLMRHSWLSSGRRESVAEHTWRAALMAMIFEPYLDKKIDLLRTIKMILIHDLVEIHYRDIPAFEDQPVDKEIRERNSLAKLLKTLPPGSRKEIKQLWQEFEIGKSLEAQLAQNIDKTEVLLQHNEAGIKHLLRKEIPLYFTYGRQSSKHDTFLEQFRELIHEETIANFKKNKVNKKLYADYL